jgi:hypothetical protein
MLPGAKPLLPQATRHAEMEAVDFLVDKHGPDAAIKLLQASHLCVTRAG